ncbi:MAG: transposase [Desulfovibrionaceae bacterium]|nr:transposase [Desulfovibrionaceae bacterium]
MEGSRDSGKKEAAVIQVNEGELRQHVSKIVRESLEDTLNAMLEAEADTLCQARWYERNAERASTRAGHDTRSVQATPGQVKRKKAFAQQKDLPKKAVAGMTLSPTV